MKKWIHASSDGYYILDATFYGQSIYDHGIESTAYDYYDAKQEAIDVARNDLEVVDSKEVREGVWEVTVGFPGVSDIQKKYRFRADSKDEAEDDAYWRAAHQLNARRYRENASIQASSNVANRFRYVVYDYDLETEEELDSLKEFSSGQKEAAIKYAEKYAKEHADEGLGAHVVIIPDDDDDEEVLEYFEYSLGGVEPYETIWTSY